MPKKTKAKRPTRTHVPLTNGATNPALVHALVIADQIGTGAAAKQSKLSQRSICRYRAALARGRYPELAKLVSEAAMEAAIRNNDLLDQAFEVTLQRIIKLTPNTTYSQALLAMEKIGDLKIAKETLNGGDGKDSTEVSPNQTVAVHTGPVFNILKPTP